MRLPTLASVVACALTAAAERNCLLLRSETCGLFGLMRVDASVRTDCAEALHEAALSGL